MTFANVFSYEGMQKFSGIASIAVENCTDELNGFESIASVACNRSTFEMNIPLYRRGIAETSGTN